MHGRPLVDWFPEERGAGLPPSERSLLKAQGMSWLSVWEVPKVVAGEAIDLSDLLSGESRNVVEKSASLTLRPGQAIPGRIVDCGDLSVLAGVHPVPLPPERIPGVLSALRQNLELRKPKAPVQILKEEKTVRTLIRLWEAEVRDLEEAASIPPQLRNTDGDELVLTTDRLSVPEGSSPQVLARRAALEGAERQASDPGGTRSYSSGPATRRTRTLEERSSWEARA